MLEPGANGTEILNGVMYVRPRLVPNFNHTQIMDVNGVHEHPLYTYLKKYCPPVDAVYRDGLTYNNLKEGDVHWNFEKFLIGRDGRVAWRYHPMQLPIDTRNEIAAELAKHARGH